ncbi:MAG: amino acid ABC transporter substrate-binding protein [Acidimicrobiia bacterium]|nr:amino acid ABC transporter substrate-binding protein [Acidimicrobiia bacterium]
MVRKIIPLLAVLALVVAACGSDDADDVTTTGSVADDTTTTAAAPDVVADDTTTTEAPEVVEVTSLQGSTLDEVKARGSLRCGVSTSAIGFAEPQDDGSFKGFDADFCRAVAAAVFGDADAVEFIGTTAAERFSALAAGEVDVLFRNTTWTQSRDTEIGGDFGPTTFYDGQQVMGKAAFGFDDSSTLADVDGARLCTNAGTTTEKNITEGARVVGAEIELVTVEAFPEAMDLFRAGSCDLVTTDGSALFGHRFSSVSNGEIAEGDWIIFPTTPISKEPLGPMYRQNDSLWADVINWTVYALIIADEKGITSANVDEMTANPPDPEAGRLLGVGDDELQSKMGLPADAFQHAIRQVGNYDEIYVNNLEALGFARPGSANARWTEGGLIYAPPAR